MKTQFDESAALLDMLLFTVRVIVASGAEDKQRIANAYQDARSLVATIGLDHEGSARPRITACFERFNAYKAAGDVAAAGWCRQCSLNRLDIATDPARERRHRSGSCLTQPRLQRTALPIADHGLKAPCQVCGGGDVR